MILQYLIDLVAETFDLHQIPDHVQHPKRGGSVPIRASRQLRSYNCGVVAGTMVFRTLRPRANVRALRRRIHLTRAGGTSTTALIRGLRASGIRVSYRRETNFDGVVHAIDAGMPVIVLVRTGDPDSHHWCVIYGYSPRPRGVFLAGNGPVLVGRRFWSWSEYRRDVEAEKPEYVVCSARRTVGQRRPSRRAA